MTQPIPATGRRKKPGMKVRRIHEVNKDAANQLKSLCAVYGSQGRALQVATELLIRQKRAVRSKYPQKGIKLTTVSYKLLPRTVELIDRLTPVYGSRGKVLSACATVLEAPV